eukprot:365907-Chlamydomonas_euryale.AAC.33
MPASLRPRVKSSGAFGPSGQFSSDLRGCRMRSTCAGWESGEGGRRGEERGMRPSSCLGHELGQL